MTTEEVVKLIFVGVDWSEDYHDVEVLAEGGQRLGRRRLGTGIEAVRDFEGLVAEHVDEPKEVVIGIETDRGLFVQALVAAGFVLYAVNPKVVSRYRDRHSVSGAKSDVGDARVLADLVRTDRHLHRVVAGDSALAEAVKVVARAHKSLIWHRQGQIANLRSNLREYYPAALEAFGEDLGHHDCLAVLERAPTPAAGRALSHRQLVVALRKGGRQRNLERRAELIGVALRAPQLEAPDLLAEAFGAATTSTVAVISAFDAQIAALESKLASAFEEHPDAEILRSLPGLGAVLGARVLGEFGDDPSRFADVRARKNYAGCAPITRASGKARLVTRRQARNARLVDALERWAFCSLRTSAGARRYYDELRARNKSHNAAIRQLANRWVGILDGCLRNRRLYDEEIAWPEPVALAA